MTTNPTQTQTNVASESKEPSTLDVSVGPQHPGSGHVRILMRVDGDYIVSIDPDIGYVHRGCEKIAENRNYVSNIPHLERPCIIDAIHLNWAYVLPVEELQGVRVPPRGQYISTIAAEMNRIMSHLYWLAINAGVFSGHTTIFMWAFGDRDLFIELAEMLTGARLTYSFLPPGGPRRDLPFGFEDKLTKLLDYFEKRLIEYDRIFFSNPLVIARAKGIGVITREDAVKLGVAGPVLRGSGIEYDIRKVEPYGAYPDLEFQIPTFKEGDSYARFLVRFEEMKQSISILRQALKKIPKGPIARKAPLVAPEGEAVGRVESSRGECAVMVMGDNSDKPYRVRVMNGSFRNLVAMPYLIRNVHIADMPIIYGSLDYWPVEADR
ncbi:MAG TPA: NADH-quinone oxidoreductase subunit D [Candidatus Saccharimonadales bacterium]|jgi:NADH-quinone oxidoreductase subunit D|nr:NADH-quinone oxidoreductase subunit D [Candidatus Saccharimonadales bacterium]